MCACLNARKNLKISNSKTDELYLIKLTFSVYICIFSMNLSLIRLKMKKTTSTICYNCRYYCSLWSQKWKRQFFHR